MSRFTCGHYTLSRWLSGSVRCRSNFQMLSDLSLTSVQIRESGSGTTSTPTPSPPGDPTFQLRSGVSVRRQKDRIFVEARIRAHAARMSLRRRGVEVASVRHVLLRPFSPLPALTIACRPTGWHGESGAANRGGGHVTVDFLKRNGVHVTTQHVYRTGAAYRTGWERWRRRTPP
ncbi:hypothetical protein BJY52DRAFT_1228562 [Lactarius psammicola]|nr:hypothetical protein BJY52DRAFT_1228562 [Lactarius psammicola]